MNDPFPDLRTLFALLALSVTVACGASPRVAPDVVATTPSAPRTRPNPQVTAMFEDGDNGELCHPGG